MINFIKVKDKYSNSIYWININHIVCIRQSGNSSVITINHHNNIDIVVDESPAYIFNLIQNEVLCKRSNI